MKSLNFKEIDDQIKPTYYNSDSDTIKEFLLPVLKRTKIYKRESYSFSSAIYSLINDALIDIIENDCKIYYIVGLDLNEDDWEAIADGLTAGRKIIENEIKLEFGKIENLIKKLKNPYDRERKKHRLKVLSYLVSTGILKIKIGFVTKKGRIKNPTKYKFHPKIMIFKDFEGNTIVANGSTNESLGGHEHNEESFNVFKSWNKSSLVFMEDHIKKFEDFWTNASENIKTIPINALVNNEIVNRFKKPYFKGKQEIFNIEKELNFLYLKSLKKGSEKENKSEIKKEILEKNEEIEKNVLQLRDYQKEAVNKWFENKKKGFFRMATGTGKTETSIGVLFDLMNKEIPLFTVIVTNGVSMVEQWIERLKRYGITSFGACSKYSDWRIKFKKISTAVSLGYENKGICITTYQTFSSNDFIEIVKEIGCKTFIIADEVHHAGAPEFKKGLLDSYDYRLGLSATPKRWFDKEGTKFLESYFGDTVYSFSMKEAMTKINPSTGKTFLCKYKYYPILVDFTKEENDKYLDLTKKIGRRAHIIKKYDFNDPIIKGLTLKRSELKNNASLKLFELENLFKKLGSELTYCIIYCTSKQMVFIKKLLQKYKKIYTEFTQYQNATQRNKILSNFDMGREKGGYDILLAIDCLNEGIDLPEAKLGIFLENGTNPVEFIQRRGRLLRQGKKKEFSTFYDFIVEPNFDKTDKELEKKLIQKEFDRFIEFAHLSINSISAIKSMNKIIKDYSLVFNIDSEI
ncbi:MAG: DEAD/DEAH box helicase family protein [Candidatus Nanoarchaeia archaeon]|nr:DEAD/DEAH box helicase family protein [Candidatus Nanoarchaeia archaeon]